MNSATAWRVVPKVFWICAAITIVAWAMQPGYDVGWDLRVYKEAVTSLRAGHDPYADGIAIQKVFHSHLAEHPTAPPPFTYVYSPITLPLLRAVGRLPFLVTGGAYWVLYAVAILLTLRACWFVLEKDERRVFAYLAPAAVFFPGLLQNDVLFSGNIAYILYGFVLAAAVQGWKNRTWWPFYAAVLAASCFKAPLLSLLVIPVFSARRQWVPAGVTGVAGLGLFGIQPHVWPDLFRHYIEAVELQFSFNHDFSSSPAGLLADALYDVVPYRVTSVVFYLVYAVPLLGALFYFSRKYLAGHISQKQWLPVLLTGTILLNPRVMEYDVAPITLVMATVAWRAFAFDNTRSRTILELSLFFLMVNAFAAQSWRPTECLTLVSVCAAGMWTLFRKIRSEERRGAALRQELEAEMSYVTAAR